jgi:hypothetical protein
MFTLLFLVAFWLSNLLIFFSKMNLAPQSIIDYYLGSEEKYTLAKTYRGMLEITHSHLAIMAVVILLLTHLFIFTSFSRQLKISVVAIFFGSAFLGEAASWFIRFVHPGFAWLKILAFILLQISMLFVIISLIKYLLQSNSSL